MIRAILLTATIIALLTFRLSAQETSQSANSDLSAQTPPAPKTIDTGNIAFLIKDIRKIRMPSDYYAGDKNKFVVVPVEILAKQYTFRARIEHTKDIAVAWSKASNTRLMYGYDISGYTDENLHRLISDGANGTSFFYTSRRYSGDKFYSSIPVFSTTSRDVAVTVEGISKLFETAADWTVGEGKISEMTRKNYILTDKYIVDFSPTQFLITGDQRWNVYTDTEITKTTMSRFEQ